MIDGYCRILHDNRYKVTDQRRAILQSIQATRGGHMTAEEIFLEVKKDHPEIGIATIYRTMDLFARLDIVRRTSFDEGKFRYEICDDSGHYHHHFICHGCGAILEVEEDLLNLLEMALESRGFEVTDHKVNLFGFCPKCKNK